MHDLRERGRLPRSIDADHGDDIRFMGFFLGLDPVDEIEWFDVEELFNRLLEPREYEVIDVAFRDAARRELLFQILFDLLDDLDRDVVLEQRDFKVPEDLLEFRFRNLNGREALLDARKEPFLLLDGSIFGRRFCALRVLSFSDSGYSYSGVFL